MYLSLHPAFWGFCSLLCRRSEEEARMLSALSAGSLRGSLSRKKVILSVLRNVLSKASGRAVRGRALAQQGMHAACCLPAETTAEEQLRCLLGYFLVKAMGFLFAKDGRTDTYTLSLSCLPPPPFFFQRAPSRSYLPQHSPSRPAKKAARNKGPRRQLQLCSPTVSMQLCALATTTT